MSQRTALFREMRAVIQGGGSITALSQRLREEEKPSMCIAFDSTTCLLLKAIMMHRSVALSAMLKIPADAKRPSA